MFIEQIGNIQGMLTLFLAYILATTPAGWFRAWVAEKMGDDTAERIGLLTLNPIEHFDPIGFTFLVFSRYIFGFIIGWGRHVPISLDNFYGPNARIRYIIASCSDVFMHLFMATCAMTVLAYLFDPSMQMTVYCLAMILLFSGATPATLEGFNVGALPSSFSLSLGYVLSVFFYLNIFFAVISLLSTIIMNVMAFLLTRFDIERYYVFVFIGVLLLAAFLGGMIKPFFWKMTMSLGNTCATYIKA